MSRGPFGRLDANTRAVMYENEAETWEGVIRERQRFADEYTDPSDKTAAQAHVEIGKRRLAHCIEIRDAYVRVAKGLPPFAAEHGNGATGGESK
jgi:hypothetical protein